MAFWKALRGYWTIVVRLQFDHRLLDVGVDAAEYADEHLVAEQRRFRGHRLAVVVALVKRDHRFGHSGEWLIADQRRIGGRHAAFSLVLRADGAREAEGRGPNERSTTTIATSGLPSHGPACEHTEVAL